MRAVAAKPISLECAAKSHVKAAQNQTQTAAPVTVSDVPGSIPFIQRKSLCPCDGGCPRCTNGGVIQPKLTIGQPNDKYEAEADRVADQIMRMPETRIQRETACTSCDDFDEEDQIQTKPIGDQITPLVQRQEETEIEEEEEEEEAVQPKRFSNKATPMTNGLQNQIQSLQGSGQSLSAETRGFFEPRFGRDFSSVRVHTDSQAAELTKSLNAKAFTSGNNIVFGAGHYSPSTSQGKHLLGHELTHVVQQAGAQQPGFIQRQGSKADQAKRLKAANDAARTRARTETKVPAAEPHWATTLSPGHLADLEKVLNYLKTTIKDLEAGIKKLDQAMNKLRDAVGIITVTKKTVRRLRARGVGEYTAITEFQKAKSAVDEAKKLLVESKAKGIAGLDGWIKKVADLSTKLKNAVSSFRAAGKVDLAILDKLRDQIDKVRSKFKAVDYTFKDTPGAAKNVQFVLRYFLALNLPGFSGTPALKEAVAIRTSLGSVDSNMVKVFGGSTGDYKLFNEFEGQLREQIWVRAEMLKALAKDPGLKPAEADVKKWFRKLKTSSNADVVNAYQRFAEGFFIHRFEADPNIVAAKQTMSTIFARPTTLSNARLVVCSGFAVLGRTLLHSAGADFKKYYIGIRASDYQIKCTLTFDDVHTLAYLTRRDPGTKNIENWYVSNEKVVSTKDEGIGPNAVSWTRKTNPIYEGTGSSIGISIKNALKQIAAKKRTLKITC